MSELAREIGAPIAAPLATGGGLPPFLPLGQDHDGEAALILRPATGEGTPDAGATLLADARADEGCAILALTVDDHVLAVYITRKIPLAVEIAAVAVAPEVRRRGLGRACLQDALRRAGRLPLVVESPEDTLGFFKRCGYKVVRRRTAPDGRVLYRLGGHAPTVRPVPDPLGRRPGG